MFERFRRTKDQDTTKGTMLDDAPLYFEAEVPVESKPTVRKAGKRKYVSRVDTLNTLVSYLSARQGKKVTYAAMAREINGTEGYVSALVTELMKRGTVSRSGKRGNYKFRVNHKRVNKPRKVAETPTKTPAKVSLPVAESQPKTAKEKVYGFIARNEDKLISQEDIARGAGVGTGTVGRAVLQLVEEKRIVRSEPLPRHGTRYWLYEHIETGIPEDVAQEQPAEPTRLEATTDATHLVNLVDGLVWEFIKETDQVSVVMFVRWLEQKNSQ